ncbi:right-handed parallel beta-helix repeat-containing protein [Candidatus Bathyarchaeota archaeon]|nr:right-handed parallel beta-helix repeat-containing protein [Candidatus Bathyarchaeota archaeon]
MFVLVFPVFPSQTTGNTIYIRSDGTVDPPTAPIQRVADVYTLTSNINESIVIERDNIVVDGAGYILQSDGGIGFSLSHRANVTVKNCRVTGFLIGIKLEYSNDTTISYNTVTNNGYYAIYLQYSNNNTILGNTATNNNYGIYLQDSGNNTLSNNIAANNVYCAFYLDHSNNSVISRNIATSNRDGFFAHYSSHNTFADNTATNNDAYGIKLYHSNKNTLSHNTAKNNGNYGVYLNSSGNCMLSGNVMSGNKYNFAVYGVSSSDFDNTVDLTNLADGKPIYYLKNASNVVLDSSTNAATIYAINCANITISNLNLINNAYGIFLWSTDNSRIENVTASNNQYGIYLHDCFADQDIMGWDPWYSSGLFGILWSNITTNCYGIYMDNCTNYILAENAVTNNTLVGIQLYCSDNNLVVDNVAKNNENGFVLKSSNFNWIATWWIPPQAVSTASNNTNYGIHLENSTNNWINWNTVENNGHYGIYLWDSDNNQIDGNTVVNCSKGILLWDSCNNTVSKNTVSYSDSRGIQLIDSPNTKVLDNSAVNNTMGISITGENSVVSANTMFGNKYNFAVFPSFDYPPGSGYPGLDIIVDETNIADGKPICYLKNASNILLDSSTNAATIYIIDSTNVTIKDLNLTDNAYGIFFWNTNNSRIENTVTTNNWKAGVELSYCDNITISGSMIANTIWTGINVRGSCHNVTVYGTTVKNISNWGIMLDGASNSFLSTNTITNNGDGFRLDAGIYLVRSSGNVLAGNTIANNVPNGVLLASGTSNNSLFHNNIINNEVVDLGSTTWDNGAEGNCWSDYTGQDLDGNGIGDTPFFVDLAKNIQDNYPLMETWSQTRSFSIKWAKETYKVLTVSNSTIASLTFSQTDKQISFKTTGPSGSTGFCNVTIPKELLDSPPDQWTITVNNETVTPIVTENATHTFIYFTFAHSTQTANIKGTNTVDNTPPITNAGPNQIVNEDTTVTFDGSASTDNIGITSYLWTFIDKTPQTLTGVSPTYHFMTPRTYTITLNVTDLRGNWDTDTIIIIVLDITAPIADAGPNQTVDEDTLVTFDGSASTDNIAITNYTWTFTDGTTKTLTGENSTYIFQTSGNYTITLNVTDAEGNGDTGTMTVTVLAVPVPIWTQWWFMAVLFVPMSSGLSYLIFRYRRREGVFEQLRKLVRQRVRDIITEEHYQGKLKELRETSDIDTRERIKEYLPHLIAFERGIMFVDKEKKKE